MRVHPTPNSSAISGSWYVSTSPKRGSEAVLACSMSICRGVKTNSNNRGENFLAPVGVRRRPLPLLRAMPPVDDVTGRIDIRPDQHRARAATTGIGADHPHLFQRIHDPPGARIANIQATLQLRGRRLTLAGHYPDGLFEHGVSFVQHSSTGQGTFPGGYLVFDLVVTLPEPNHPLHFGIADITTLQTHRGHRVRSLEQHVASADQVFRAHCINDHPRVYARRHVEGDAGREVGFDQP